MSRRQNRRQRSDARHLRLTHLEDRISPALLYALNATGNGLLSFDSATPGTLNPTLAITGLNTGEALQGIDFRPDTGELFAVGVAGSAGRIGTINLTSGAFSPIGASFIVAGNDFGFDFNPTNDRIRLTSDADINFLINPNDGVVTIQGALNPGDPNVVGSAYSNNFGTATATTLFALDSGTDSLMTQVPATGTLTLVGSTGVAFDGSVGFDISGDGVALASLTVSGISSLYTINVSTGAATLVGQIGSTATVVRGLAVARFVWDGGGGNANWTTAANWAGDFAPSAGSDLVFPNGAAQLSNVNDFAASTTFNSLTFNGVNYVITGNSIGLSRGIVTNVPSGGALDVGPSFGPEITLLNSQTFEANGVLGLTQLGAVVLNGNTLTVTNTGASTAPTTIAGSISESGAIIKNGAGTLTLSGSVGNTYTGTTTINAGTLSLNKSSGNAVSGDVVINSGTVQLLASDQIADSANVTVNAGGLLDLNGFSEIIASLTLNGGQFLDNAGVLTVTGLTLINGTAGADDVQIGGAAGAFIVTVNGLTSGRFTGPFTIDAGGDTNTLTGPDADSIWNLTGIGSGNIGGTITFQNFTNLVGGLGADSFVFTDAGGVTGTIDGGAGGDTLDYSAVTTVVAVNLGTNAPGFVATLDGDQEVPNTTSTATGTATLAYNNVTHTFDITVTVTGIMAADVTGFHIHRAVVDVNGPIIVDFGTTNLVPTPDGFTFTATGLPLDPAHEAALLGGGTYLNVHTAEFPGGAIRGQLFASAAFGAAPGTASGTGGVSNVENATGGSGSFTVDTTEFGDSLVGDGAANTLLGGPGNDFIVGARGNDTMNGQADDDIMVWSNGDGSDVMDGTTGSDIVQVNGAVAGGDQFLIQTNPADNTRVRFDRTNLGLFNLNIGTVETLTVNGIGGDDTFTVFDNLATVTDLSLIDLGGFDGNDTFNVTPTVNATVNVSGHLPRPSATPGDVLNVNTAGTTNGALTADETSSGFEGSFTFGNRAPVSFREMEALSPTASDLAITKTDNQTTAIPGTTVTYTIVVTNNGPLLVNGATVTDQFPSVLTNVTFTSTATGGATGNTASGTGNIADTVNLPAGSTITYIVTATILSSATGTITNTASVMAPPTQTDPNPGNNTATDTNTLTPQADLSVVKTGPSGPIAVGGTITYTITVLNLGPSDAQSISLSDMVPTNTTFVSFTAPVTWTTTTPPVGGTGTVTATIGGLTAGSGPQVFTLVVTVGTTVPPNTVVSNTATVSSTTFDPMPGNNTSTQTTNVNVVLAPIVTGAGEGGGPHVEVFDGQTGALRFSFFAYDVAFLGGVRVASGDVNRDGVPDIITAAGPTGGPHVKVFDGRNLALLASFFAYGAAFTGGVFVGSGDVNGDGFADIITGAGAGGGPHVKVFSGATFGELESFFAYSPLFTGGVTVAGGDVTGDGKADVITGAGAGGGPHVRVFDVDRDVVVYDFFAYSPAFLGGVFVGAGDVDGDGRADIVTGAGQGGGSHVEVFSGADLSLISSFFAYPGFFGGVRVAAGDLDGDGRAEVITGAGPGGGPHVQAFEIPSLDSIASFFAYSAAFAGGVYVG